MRRLSIGLLVALTTIIGCGERQAGGGDSGQPGGDSQTTAGDGGSEGYEFTFCEKGEVHTARCTGGLCDPAPFEVCADGSCVLEPATCEPATEPPGVAVAVTIRNTGIGTLYLDGMRARPFSIRGSGGEQYEPGSGLFGGSCDSCADLCANNMHGDPAPCYLELAPGAELMVSWDGKLYEQSKCQPCGVSCHSTKPAADGAYTFVVPYRTALDQLGYDVQQIDCGSIAGLPSWMGATLGFADLDQQAEVAVSYSGQTELLLEIK